MTTTDLKPDRVSLEDARTLLYVPGSRPDRFPKAAESGADQMVIDLEDAVAPHQKDVARQNARTWLAAGHRCLIRINGMGTPWYESDMAMLSDFPSAVIVPKAARSVHVTDVIGRLPSGSCAIPIIETAAGVIAAREVCGTDGVVRVIFGSMDLANELGVDHTDRATLVHARFMVVLASAAAGIASPLDGVTTWIADEKRIELDAREAAAMGFTGKSCVHPRQVPIVRDVFTPSSEDLSWAQRIVAAEGTGSATVVNGQLIGKPVVERARKLIDKSRAHDAAPLSS
jgi:citrate lyase subunit beta / citryl-CoA lyase